MPGQESKNDYNPNNFNRGREMTYDVIICNYCGKRGHKLACDCRFLQSNSFTVNRYSDSSHRQQSVNFFWKH
jgi:hypothetical protein